MHRLVLSRLRWRPQDADAVALRGFAARYAQLPVWEAMLARWNGSSGTSRPRAGAW